MEDIGCPIEIRRRITDIVAFASDGDSSATSIDIIQIHKDRTHLVTILKLPQKGKALKKAICSSQGLMPDFPNCTILQRRAQHSDPVLYSVRTQTT